MRKTALLLALSALALACRGRQAPPAAAPAGRLRAAVRDARNAPACRAGVAQEWAVGWPVPLDAPGGRRFKVFFYPVTGAPPQEPRPASPAAEAVVDADAGAVECAAVSVVPKDLPGARWTSAAEGLDDAAFAASSDKLDALTETLAAAYAAKRAPDAAAAKEYAALFETMAEPPLLPYYYRLNPAFWEWLRAAAGRSIPKA